MRLFLFFSLFLTFAIPATAQEAGGTITTETSAQQDAAIAIRIREILGELGNYDDVSVTVSEGVVTLRGTTTSALEAIELDPLAARVEGADQRGLREDRCDAEVRQRSQGETQ